MGRTSTTFFQRYGYTIPGYGTIGDHSPLRTSEFTHHDFFVSGDLDEVTAYYSDVLGFKLEGETVIDGEWQPGPKAVFQMGPGDHTGIEALCRPIISAANSSSSQLMVYTKLMIALIDSALAS